MSNNICFAFSIHKAGSTLFYNLLQRSMYRANELKIKNALRYVSIPDNLFNAGVSEGELIDRDFPNKHNIDVAAAGTLYGGFRFVPGFATDGFLADKPVMVLLRDPRDAMTSLYFSTQKSHRVPTGEAGKIMEKLRATAQVQDIDEFVLARATPQLAARFSRLGAIRNLGVSWRYEDIVFEKARWLDEILSYLDIDLPADSRKEFVAAEDIKPENENVDQHIRQVSPGDHKRKLRPETIEKLNVIFKDTLETWNY